MRTCRHCQVQYEARDWEKSRGDYLCRSCRSEYNKAYRKRRKTRFNYPSDTPSTPYLQPHSKRGKPRSEESKKKYNAYRRQRYAREGGGKSKVRQVVKDRLRAGRLTKGPCAICGEDHTIAHHRDYSKPLWITWLCIRCHIRVHRNRRARGLD